MENIRNLLSTKRKEISDSLDIVINNFKKVINEKNNKISDYKKEINILKTKTKKTITITDLKEYKINNKLIYKLYKNVLKIKKLKKDIIKIQKNSNEISINAKDMTAFKLVAVELDKKEKIIKENKDTINNLNNKIKELENKIENQLKENNNLNNTINKLKNDNIKLLDTNNLQSKTIETFTIELNNKKNKINELKSCFFDILNDYNDILLKVENYD